MNISYESIDLSVRRSVCITKFSVFQGCRRLERKEMLLYAKKININIIGVSLKPQFPRCWNEGLDRVSFYLDVALLHVVQIAR